MPIGNFTIPQKNRSRKPNRELIITVAPPHIMIDGGAARKFLIGLAAVLERAAASADGKEVLAGLDYIRRAPAMLSVLEVQP
jgi:hypothetical protein